jgi:enoyl-CoA hydratase/carnithine racemase
MKHPKLEVAKHIANRPTSHGAVCVLVTELLREDLEKNLEKDRKACKEIEQELALTIRDFREGVEKEMRQAAESGG